MRVLVGCEFSGVVRRAFRARGHDAYSCDLLPVQDGDSEHHIQGDILEVLRDPYKWDLMIAHPPCTYLTTSAAWAFGLGPYHQKVKPETLTGLTRCAARSEALQFVLALWNAPIPRICIENPGGFLSSMWMKPTQTIQPWQFGDDASKSTALRLRNLPLLVATGVLPGGKAARRSNQTASGQNRLGPSPDRWKLRSVTYPGIADAMADQWGCL